MEKKPSIMTWLLAAGLSIALLPDLVMEVCAVGIGGPKPVLPSLIINLAAALVSLVFFMWSVYIRFGKASDSEENRIDWLSYLAGIFPCLLVILVVFYGSHSMIPVFAASYGAGKGLFAGIACVLAAVLCLILGILFFCCVNGCRRKRLKHPVQRFFSRIYIGIPMSVLLWLAILVPSLGLALVKHVWKTPNMLIRHFILTAGSFVMAILLNGVVVLAEKMMAGAELAEKLDIGTDKKVTSKKHVMSLGAMVLCFVLVFSQNITRLTGNQAAMLDAWLKDSLVEYGFSLAAADIGRAGRIAEAAVWQMEEALSAAEKEEKDAAEDSKALKKAEKKIKALKKVCEKYEVFWTDGRSLAFLEKWKRQGGTDKELAEDALLLADEYPENLRIQYAAAVIGSSLAYDGAKHYDQTAKAALRFRELYIEEKGLTDAEQTAFEKEIARMLLKVYHEEEAAELLEPLAEKNSEGDGELYELLAQCYDRVDRQEDAYELAAAYCENWDSSPYLMYYAALTALKLERTAECLQYTSRLASYTAGCSGETLNQCDTWLFEMLEYLTLSDNRSFTDFRYDIYEELTEEENAVINENSFFRNYLDAVYLAYRSSQKSEPEEAFSKIEAVLKENPKLASAWYLCGIIASNAGGQEYGEGAVEFYQKAGKLNDKIPAVWYAMAREYDRMEEYEKGIEACKKALALLPDQDHGSDWYGINYHCSRLLHALESETGR